MDKKYLGNVPQGLIEKSLRAGKIKSVSLSVQVFEAKAPKEEYLKDLDNEDNHNDVDSLSV